MRIIAILLVAICSVLAGYWLGFRQGWNMSLMANAPVRGAISAAQMKALEAGRPDAIRPILDADIDSGLIWWDELEQSPLRGALNVLSGEDVLPDHLRYVRRVASYRKAHASPLADPKVIARMLESVRADDPALGDQLAESGGQSEAAMARMIEKYGE